MVHYHSTKKEKKAKQKTEFLICNKNDIFVFERALSLWKPDREWQEQLAIAAALYKHICTRPFFSDNAGDNNIFKSVVVVMVTLHYSKQTQCWLKKSATGFLNIWQELHIYLSSHSRGHECYVYMFHERNWHKSNPCVNDKNYFKTLTKPVMLSIPCLKGLKIKKCLKCVKKIK